MIMDILKNILSMADEPGKLGRYITYQIRELIGSQFVVLLHHAEGTNGITHEIIGICPERKLNNLNSEFIGKVADLSHDFHSPALINHKQTILGFEELFDSFGGDYSIIVPLEYSSKRVGVLLMVDIIDKHNIDSVIETLNLLSAVIALELRNAYFYLTLEHKVAERTKELEESKFRFDIAMQASKDGIFDWDLISNKIYYSPGWKEMLGYHENEIENDFSVWERLTDSEDVKKSWEMLNQLIRKEIDRFELEFKMKHKLGHWVDILSRANVIFNNEGKAVRVIGTHTDISNSKSMMLALKQSEAKFRAMVESSSDLIWETNMDGLYTYVSPQIEALSGYKPYEVIGKSPFDFTTDEEKDALIKTSDAIIDSGKAFNSLTNIMKHRCGEIIYLETSGVPIYDVYGKLCGYRGVSRNTTDRKIAEDKIKQLNEELEQRVIERTAQLEEAVNELEAFSYSISHDLRAPLRHINSFISLFLEKVGAQLNNEEISYLKVASDSAKELGELIEALLSFSRLSRRDLSKNMISMKLNVEDVVARFISEYNGRNVDFKIGNLSDINGDAKLINQVWVNLISNALKYTSKKEYALIEIDSYVKDNEIVYFVKDNGAGFDMKYVDKLFGVFQRLHKTKDFEGVGIGLANVKRIISRHGGKCWAEAEINKGACFYFSLPIDIV